VTGDIGPARAPLPSFARLFGAPLLFAIAFGWVEAAVVVYLRAIYYPGGFRFPLTLASMPHAAVEIAREAATIVMLGAVAHAAGRTRWERFGHFAFVFGVWDIAFYLGLRAALGWPESLLTWDVLFLIPLVWTGPVLAPVLVSVLLIVSGGWIARRERAGEPIRVRRLHWFFGVVSIALLLYSFTANHALVYAGAVPAAFPWFPFACGLGVGAGLAISVLKR